MAESIGIQAVLDDRNFTAGLSRFTKGLSTMESGATSTANVLSSIGKIASGALVVGIGAATAAIGGLVAASKIGLDSALRYAEGLDDLGNKFGLTGQDAAKWTQAFNHVGLSVEEGTMGLNTLTRGLLDTAEALKDPKAKPTAFAEALGKLGVKAVDAKGKVKSFNAVMPEIMDGFKKLPKGIEKTNLAMSIFGGRGGSKFLEFLDQGSEGLAKAEALVKQYGLALTDAQVEALDDFSKAQNDINAAFKGMQVQIGIAVLPIVKRLSDYFSTNVVPVFNKFVQDTLPKLVAGFDKFVAFLQINVLPIVDRLKQAFDKGGIGGIIDQLGIELTKAFKGFDLANILGGLGASLSTAWTKTIQPELIKWGTQFWDWLTGKGGALEQAGAQLGKVATEIQTWATKNAPDWLKTFETWKTSFWNWLTDPAGGVVATIATNFVKLTEQIKLWAESPSATEKFIEVGESIATTIIQGIAGLFAKDPRDSAGRNVFVILGESLATAARNIGATLESIGQGIAQGVLQGIAKGFYGASDSDARNAANGVISFMQRWVQLIIEWGTIPGLVNKLFQQFVASWNASFGLFLPNLPTPGNLIPPATQTQPGITVTGKPRPGVFGATTSGAVSGAASSISQPVITNNSTASRSVSVSFAPGSMAFSGASAGDVENIAQTIANRTVAAVLAAA